MNAPDRNHPNPSLDAFIDGQLSPEAHEEMLRRIQADPLLRAEYERQKALDVALKRAFAPSAFRADFLPPAVHQAYGAGVTRLSATGRRNAPRRIIRLTAAAVVVISLGYAGWMVLHYLVLAPVGPSAAQPLVRRLPRTFAQEYAAISQGGFKPAWVCADDAQFARTFRTLLGEELLFQPDPPAAVMVGLSYSRSISPSTIVFLGLVRGQRALVFVDRSENDKHYSLAPGSGLYLFRRQVGQLVLYEITPLTKPGLLDHFHQPKPAGG